MNEARLVSVSKRMSRHLRHAPEEIGITLDAAGWVAVADLIAALRITRAELETVVAGNDKRRFAFDETGELIRASQGHSVAVDLGLEAAVPPATLYHGTVERFLPAILSEGLRPMKRHAVHLSADVETAHRVGSRRGSATILVIDAAAMSADGHTFHRSANGVWLTSTVPPRYLTRRA
ncbi:RNA 2'-phosphotransferase [Allokutzneria multivorans]|uniref:Probable RNA 2'-phosphotransferase n=1 Tax=Allokutzneria multivorans TaxID=1142134 RepID=A0ABP7TFR0_9PSEU